MSEVLSLWKGVIVTFTTPPGEWREKVRQAAEDHGVTVKEIMSDDVTRRVSHARQDAMWRVFKMTYADGTRRFSYPQIGRFFSRDHTTIMYAVDAHERRSAAPIDQVTLAAG